MSVRLNIPCQTFNGVSKANVIQQIDKNICFYQEKEKDIKFKYSKLFYNILSTYHYLKINVINNNKSIF